MLSVRRLVVPQLEGSNSKPAIIRASYKGRLDVLQDVLDDTVKITNDETRRKFPKHTRSTQTPPNDQFFSVSANFIQNGINITPFHSPEPVKDQLTITVQPKACGLGGITYSPIADNYAKRFADGLAGATFTATC